MAVAIRTTDFPEGVGTAMYDGVQAAMDIANNPPEGLIFHWAGEVDGKWTVTDVWGADARGIREFPRTTTIPGHQNGFRHGSGRRSPADNYRVRCPQLRQAVAACGHPRHGAPVPRSWCSRTFIRTTPGRSRSARC